MSSFIRDVKQLLSGIITSVNSKVWDLYISKRKAFVRMKVYKSYAYEFFPQGYITERLYRYSFQRGGSFETKTFSMLDQYVRPGITVLDIGANIGIYSLYLSERIGPEGKIFAFEPDKKTFALLQKNLEKNKCNNVLPVNCALSNENGTATIGLPAGFEDSSIKYSDAFNVIGKIQGAQNNVVSDNLTDVRLLDDFVEENGISNVDLIKMDIEGAELLCVEGAVGTLARFKPVIIFEGDEERVKNFDYDLFKLLLFIHQMGYKLTNYDSGQWLAVPSEGS